MDHNTQDEIGLHNLDVLMGVRQGKFVARPILHKIYMLVGLYGAVSWVLLLSVKKTNVLISPYVIPNWYLAIYFLQVLVHYFYNDYVRPEPGGMFGLERDVLGLGWGEQEPAELILGMGFFLFVVTNLLRQIRDKSPSTQLGR